MSLKLNRLAALTAACLAVGLPCKAPGADIDGLRVYSTEPATFDYVFTSAVTVPGGRVALSFNHRNGRTAFRSLGERLDNDWTIAGYVPRKVMVFNASINAEQERDRGEVTLHGPDGATRVLVQGERLPASGWAAWLITADTGRGWLVEAGDPLPLGDSNLVVQAISSNAVTLAVDGRPRDVPWLSADERQALIAMFAAQRQALLAAQQRAAELRREEEARAEAAEAARPPARPSVRPSVGASSSFATIYRYPVEFTVVPGLIDPTTGKVVQETVVVPTRFETRAVGTGLEVH